MNNIYTLVIAHGSRDERWKQPFESLMQRLAQAYTGQNLSNQIGLAYMEMTTPTPFDVLKAVDLDKVKHIQILPFFMASGAHVANEIQEIREAIQALHPLKQVSVLPPVGEDPQVQTVFLKVLQDALSNE